MLNPVVYVIKYILILIYLLAKYIELVMLTSNRDWMMFSGKMARIKWKSSTKAACSAKVWHQLEVYFSKKKYLTPVDLYKSMNGYLSKKDFDI